MEHEETDNEFWARMAARMEENARRWWIDRRDLTVLRSACAGIEMRYHTSLWGKNIADVVHSL